MFICCLLGIFVMSSQDWIQISKKSCIWNTFLKCLYDYLIRKKTKVDIKRKGSEPISRRYMVYSNVVMSVNKSHSEVETKNKHLDKF